MADKKHFDDIGQLEYSEGKVWERNANGQKMLTVSADSDIEPGEEVVVIREAKFDRICEVLD